ncbi:hypothetical protein TWF481_010377 [Arthrobotrys musiformis]|uniref:Uncharacterized protein n=1 Tax=Arthrobotrys musiformis TaxID=47236 RepID=A0AAV9W2Z2_9PEZI
MFLNHYANKDLHWNIQNMVFEDTEVGETYKFTTSTLDLNRDPGVPSKLTGEQVEAYRDDREWQALEKQCNNLKARIRNSSGNIETLRVKLKDARRLREARRRKVRDGTLRDLKESYHRNSSANIIRAQNDDIPAPQRKPDSEIKYELRSRRELVDIFYRAPLPSYSMWWAALYRLISLAESREAEDDLKSAPSPTKYAKRKVRASQCKTSSTGIAKTKSAAATSRLAPKKRQCKKDRCSSKAQLS